ncbi:MAG: DNA-processing protein DprA [Actinomycetota bacterium]
MSGPGAPADPNPFLVPEKSELLAMLVLEGMTTRRASSLLSVYGSPAQAWHAVRSGGLRDPALQAFSSGWASAARGVDPGGLLASLESGGTRFLARGEPGYPTLLRAIEDPPLGLFCRGTPPPGDATLVAVVGARKASPYGLEVARWLSAELARAGVGIVSGAAYGIDSAAHESALDAAGYSCAVLGCGIDVVYPRSQAGLYRRLEAAGCILSEYPPGVHPAKERFPARNRIIAGMTPGVVVVEASGSSGALITARFALDGGREVMAVPGQVLSDNSAGTNALIREGAVAITSPEDVLEGLGLDRLFKPDRTAGEHMAPAGPEQAAVLRALERGFCDVEDLVRSVGLSAGRTLSLLAAMEVEGLVVRGRGGRYQVGPR